MSSPDDILYYFSGSADKAPGSGVNEYVGDVSAYHELASIPSWRRILSNFYEDEFVYEGFRYRSVEHAFQGQKIAMADGQKAYEFTMDSGSRLGLGTGLDARKARKMVVLSHEDIATWDKIKMIVMKEILYARFSTSALGRRVLLATGNAQLWHGARGIPKERQVWLEDVRDMVR